MIALRVLTWSIWQRNSRWLLIIAAYIVLFCTQLARYMASEEHPFKSGILGLVLVFCYLGLTGILMYQDTDVSLRGSAYPGHMFTLPVRTFQLVLTPMVIGTVVFVGSGLAVSRAIHANYLPFPLYWPALMLGALLAMLQALFWYPIGVQYAKLVLTLASIPTLIFLVGRSLEDKVSEMVVCQWLAVFIATCYAVAYHGVVRARRGDIQMFTLGGPIIAEKPAKKFKWLNFKDKFAAQRWYEWRQQGLILPSLVTFLCVLFGLLVQTDSTIGIAYEFNQSEAGLIPMVPSFIRVYSYLFLWLVPTIAWVVGCGARRSDIKYSDRTFYLFFGTRPMNNGGLVAQKLLVALKSSIAAWIVVFGFIILLFQTQGRVWDSKEQLILEGTPSILSLLIRFSSPVLVWWILGALTILFAVTWRNFAIGFWTELSGKVWLRYGYPISIVAAIVGTNILSAATQGRQSPSIINQSNVTAIIWVVIVVRICIATFLVIRQRRTGLMTVQTLFKGILGYAAALTTLSTLAFVMTAEIRMELIRPNGFTNGSLLALLFGLVLLWTPIVRILLATEMLHQNRHRAN